MALNAQNLAEGVVHWVEFEIRAGREKLIGEAYLAVPIAQLLQASGAGEVFAEEEHPVLTDKEASGRRPSIDFTVKSSTNVGVCVAETKWVVESREFNRELYYDIAKLELVPEAADLGRRWLIVAGRWKSLKAKLIDRELNVGDGGGRVSAFASLLSFDIAAANATFNVSTCEAPLRKEWARMARVDVVGDVSDRVTSCLVAVYPSLTPPPSPDQVVCLIWNIRRHPDRADWHA